MSSTLPKGSSVYDRDLMRTDSFDYATASQAEIMDLALELPGLLLGQIPGARFTATEGVRGKSEAGLAVEAFFGIPPNQRSEADFPGAGIELKVVPLVRSKKGVRIKERTVVSMIDFGKIAEQSWETASVRKKLHILFVFFEHLLGQPKRTFPITHVTLWEPSGLVEEQIKEDWLRVQGKVLLGLAHELSESDGLVLGPCTKGVDARHLRKQPFSRELARSRAFALKPSFTWALYQETLKPIRDDAQVAELTTLDRLRQGFQRFVGRTIDDVAAGVGKAPSISKSYAASVVRSAMKTVSPIAAVQLRDSGPTIKMSRVNDESYPYEALSFPAFKHAELVDEDWEDSDLLARIEQMLIVPVRGRTRSTPQGECIIAEPIFWRPSIEQLDTIHREWTMFRDLISKGRAHDLPKESDTVAIHVRPHGRDATDVDPTPGGGHQPRKSFWLNKRFVHQILTSG